MYLCFGIFHTGTKLDIHTKAPADNMTIIIDAGHGGMDAGAVAKDGTLEKDLNLSISNMIAQILKSNGFNVILTREEDIMLSSVKHSGKKKQSDLNARVETAEKYQNPVFVSIHMNKFPDPRCRGAQVYYSKNNEKSKDLAKTIQGSLKSSLEPDNKRDIKQASTDIFILNTLKCPAVLVECGFISNQYDLDNLKNEEYQKKLSVIISAAIMNGVSNERT